MSQPSPTLSVRELRNTPRLPTHIELNNQLAPGDSISLSPHHTPDQEAKRKIAHQEFVDKYFLNYGQNPTARMIILQIQRLEMEARRPIDMDLLQREINRQAFDLGTETSGLNNIETKNRILEALDLSNPFITIAWGSKFEAARHAYMFSRRMFTGAYNESDGMLATRLAAMFQLFLNHQVKTGSAAHPTYEDPDDETKANRIDNFLRKLSAQSDFTYEKHNKQTQAQPQSAGS